MFGKFRGIVVDINQKHDFRDLRRNILLIFAICLTLVARFNSESLNQSSKIQLATVLDSSQRVDLTSFCTIFKNTKEGVSLHFQLSVPRDLNDYLIFSTSQKDRRIEFWINQDRLIFGRYKSFDWKLSEPLNTRKLIPSTLGGINDEIDETITLFRADINEQNLVAVSMEEYFMPIQEFNQIDCDDEGLVGVSANNSQTTITVSDQASPASQEATRSTVVLRSLASISLCSWFIMKWITKRPLIEGDHG